MSKEKRRVPKLRFPGFTEDWEQCKLSDITEVIMGQSPSSKNYTDNPNDDILVQGNADLKDGKVVPRLWTKEITKTIDKGGIILTVRAPVGDVAKTDYKVVLGRGVAGIKGNDYIYQFLQKLQYNRYWVSLSSGSTFESINSNDIKDLIIDIPSIEEQTKISMLLNNVNSIITLHQRKLDNLKLKKKALLQKLFPKNGERYPELRFSGFTDAWEQRKLGSIGSTYTGLSGKTKEDFGHGEAKYITYLNVFQNTISNITMTDKVEIDPTQNEVKYGDVLFTTSSETPEEVGMSSVWLGDTPNIYLNSFCFGFRPNQKIDSYFLGYSLRAPYMRDRIKILAQGISRYNISKNKVMELEISLPNNEEQKLLGTFLQRIDLIITLHQRKLDHLKLQKKALLQQMFV